MNTMKTLTLMLAMLAYPLFSKDLKAPLPEKLLLAKTIYIDNRSGQSDILDKAFTALKEWSRFEILQDRSKADVVFVFTVSRETIGAHTHGRVDENGNVTASTAPTQVGYTTMTVFDPVNDQVLFSDTRKWHLFGSATKDAVKELRKRMEPKEK